MHQRLRDAREQAGFKSASNASTAFGWSPATYRGHENGSRGITIDAVEGYASAFGVDPGWIAFGRSPSEQKIADVSDVVLREVLLLVLEAPGASKASPEELAKLVIEICKYIKKSGTGGIDRVVDFEFHRLASQRRA